MGTPGGGLGRAGYVRGGEVSGTSECGEEVLWAWMSYWESWGVSLEAALVDPLAV